MEQALPALRPEERRESHRVAQGKVSGYGQPCGRIRSTIFERGF